MMAIMDCIVKMIIVGLVNRNVLEMDFALMVIVLVIQDIVKWIAHLEIVVTMINAMIMVFVRMILHVYVMRGLKVNNVNSTNVVSKDCVIIMVIVYNMNANVIKVFLVIIVSLWVVVRMIHVIIMVYVFLGYVFAIKDSQEINVKIQNVDLM
jgi:hypothetical protein